MKYHAKNNLSSDASEVIFKNKQAKFWETTSFILCVIALFLLTSFLMIWSDEPLIFFGSFAFMFFSILSRIVMDKYMVDAFNLENKRILNLNKS